MADEANKNLPSTSRKRKALKENSLGAKKVKQDKSDEKQWISSRLRSIRKFSGRKGNPSLKSKKVDLARQVNVCDLPSLVIDKILEFISVEDMENLAKVNVFFNTWICGQHNTSADIPFKKEDLKKMREDKIIAKKPLLKLRCKVLADRFGDVPGMNRVEFVHFGYSMRLQLSLLDFSKLRELDLVPSTGKSSNQVQVRCHVEFSEKLLQSISKNGTLGKIEKFDIMVDERGMVALDFVAQMVRLRDFGLNILTKTNLKKVSYNTYIAMLDKAVSSSKAQLLRLNVINETKRKTGKKLLKSEHIRRLVFTGPCSFNGALLMPNLEVVEIDCGRDCGNKSFYEKIKDLFSFDRDIAGHNVFHIVGKCGLMAASIYQNCLRMKEFAGVPLDGIDPEQDFKKWNDKVKKRFYKEYVKSCKSRSFDLNFKYWARANWFTNRYPPVSK